MVVSGLGVALGLHERSLVSGDTQMQIGNEERHSVTQATEQSAYQFGVAATALLGVGASLAVASGVVFMIDGSGNGAGVAAAGHF